MNNEALEQLLKNAQVKFIRLIWCDNANVIRAKAVHVNYLEECIRPVAPEPGKSAGRVWTR